NSTLIPTSEILDFTSKLLSDSQIKLYRNNLRMPQLMLEEREKKYGRFIANNGLIEDPCSFEKERSFINPWFEEEREIFMEKLALYGWKLLDAWWNIIVAALKTIELHLFI
ncbi:hypothetical protein Taro_018564, partial [Colocasia esculenta]|nr:hypothetical protein [Colocasia esculenta]